MEKIVMIHGDVTFYQVNEIPINAKRIDFKKSFVIQHGENGHTHTIENDCDIYLDESTGRMYFREKAEKIQVNHQEHGLRTVETKTGIVYKDTEQEWDYESEESKNTID